MVEYLINSTIQLFNILNIIQDIANELIKIIEYYLQQFNDLAKNWKKLLNN